MQGSPKRTGDSASSAQGRKSLHHSSKAGIRKQKNRRTFSLPEDFAVRGNNFALESRTVGEATCRLFIVASSSFCWIKGLRAALAGSLGILRSDCLVRDCVKVRVQGKHTWVYLGLTRLSLRSRSKSCQPRTATEVVTVLPSEAAGCIDLRPDH